MPRQIVAVILGLVALAGLPALDFGAVEPVWTLKGPAQPVVPGQPFTVTAEVRLPAGYYQDIASPFLSFEPEGVTVVGRSSSVPTHRKDKDSFTGTFTLTRTFVLPSGTGTGQTTLNWKVGWQICQFDGVCLLPAEKELSLVLRVAASNGIAAPPLGLDFWGALVGALLGGLLLNVMPCVFPVLALKAVGMASAAGLTRRERRRDALAFAAGGWTTVTGLGIVTAVVAGLGSRLDWGFTFQQPIFVWALLLVFWLFALQLWGVWRWQGSPFAFTSPANGRARSWAGGVLLTLAAAPCTAPLLGPALGFALAQPPALIPLFFAAAGVGMVLPLLVLQAFPAWGRLLPKPGPWMVVMERVAGLFLAATVLYLLWVFTRQTAEERVWPALALLTGVAALVAAADRFRHRIVRVGAFVLVAAAFAAALPMSDSQPPAPPARGWALFSPDALQQELAAGKTVLVEGTAAWCATCQVNELTVLDRPDVAALMDRLGIIRMRADYTRPDPVIRTWLASLNRAGLPVYALYRPGTLPYLFPELLNDENFTRRLVTLPKKQQ